jgi:hypothetical protein
VVAPAAVDEDELACEALDGEAHAAQHGGAPVVLRQVVGLDAVQAQGAEGVVAHGAHGLGHVPVALGVVVQPEAQLRGLQGPSADVGEGDAAEHRGGSEGGLSRQEEETQGEASPPVLGILGQPRAPPGDGEEVVGARGRHGAEVLSVRLVVGQHARGRVRWQQGQVQARGGEQDGWGVRGHGVHREG